MRPGAFGSASRFARRGDVPDPDGLVAGLQDVAVVREATERGRGHHGVHEVGGPLGEVQVGGRDNAGVLVQLAEHLEQQRAAGLAEGQVSSSSKITTPMHGKLAAMRPALPDGAAQRRVCPPQSTSMVSVYCP